jgi:hypothetical protein
MLPRLRGNTPDSLPVRYLRIATLRERQRACFVDTTICRKRGLSGRTAVLRSGEASYAPTIHLYMLVGAKGSSPFILFAFILLDYQHHKRTNLQSSDRTIKCRGKLRSSFSRGW